MINLIIGLFIGAIVGLFAAALLRSAKDETNSYYTYDGETFQKVNDKDIFI